MDLYGHKFKTIAIKGIPVDQSSYNSFNELIQEYQVWKKQIHKWPETRNDQQTARKAWSDNVVKCYLNKFDLTCAWKPIPCKHINPTDLNYITRK